MRIALITLKAYLFCFICVVVLIILTVSITTIDLKIKKISILKIPLIKGGYDQHTVSLPCTRDDNTILEINKIKDEKNLVFA
jgi:hypothetical protein